MPLPAGGSFQLYYGAAAAESWDRNSIRAVEVKIPPGSKPRHGMRKTASSTLKD